MFSLIAPQEAMMRAKCAADSNFYLNAMWMLVTSCLEPLNSATDGPAEHLNLKIGESSSCWVSELGEDVVYSTPKRRWLNHDGWYEIMIRAVFLRRVRRFSVFGFVWRKRIEYEIASSFLDEVSQQGVLRPQSLWEQQRSLWETTEKFMGAWFLE